VVTQTGASNRLDAAPATPIVSVRDVVRTYGHGHNAVAALRGVSFDVHHSSLVAVTGR